MTTDYEPEKVETFELTPEGNLRVRKPKDNARSRCSHVCAPRKVTPSLWTKVDGFHIGCVLGGLFAAVCILWGFHILGVYADPTPGSFPSFGETLDAIVYLYTPRHIFFWGMLFNALGMSFFGDMRLRESASILFSLPLVYLAVWWVVRGVFMFIGLPPIGMGSILGAMIFGLLDVGWLVLGPLLLLAPVVFVATMGDSYNK